MRDNDSKFFPGGIPFLNLFGGDHMIQSWEKWPVFKLHPWSFHSSPLENDGWIWSVYVCLRFTPAGFCSGSMLSFRGVYGKGRLLQDLSSFFVLKNLFQNCWCSPPPPSPLRPIYKSLRFFFWGGVVRTIIVKREPMLDLKFDGCGVCGVF